VSFTLPPARSDLIQKFAFVPWLDETFIVYKLAATLMISSVNCYSFSKAKYGLSMESNAMHQRWSRGEF